MGVLSYRKSWTNLSGGEANLPDNTFLVQMDPAQRWNVWDEFVFCEYVWCVVEVDDLSHAMYIRPCGNRKAARAAIRKAFK